jgi:hypothetical protein
MLLNEAGLFMHLLLSLIAENELMNLTVLLAASATTS